MLNQRHRVISDDGGKIISLIEDTSAFLWYHRFNAGMKYCMGNMWRPNKALSTELIVKVIDHTERRRLDEDSEDGQHR